MKAITYTEYGSPNVLKLHEAEKPLPKDREVLIQIHATSVNYGDLIARRFKDVSSKEFNMPFFFWIPAKIAFGLNKPNINRLGNEFSGVVEAVGKEVSKFKTGDAVFGYPGSAMGAYAEYLIMPENGVLTHKPRNVSHEEAAVLPYGAVMALYLMRKMNIQPGQKVLILGASGNIGSAAVQIAKGYGAKVTAVCGANGIELVKTLGADKAINYAMEDFTKDGEQYDLIFDVLGKGSFANFKGSLKPNGRYLLSSFKGKQLLQMLWTSLFGSQKVICTLAPGSREDLLTVKEWIEAGKIKAVIDRRFPLEETAHAHAYAESGAKKGSVAIVVKD